MIIVFGSVNIDLVTRVGSIPRAGETVLGETYAALPGGKGANQALAARRDGAPVTLIAAVGRDPFATLALENLDRAGVDLSGIEGVDAPTGAAFIAVDDRGENAIVVASGANAMLRANSLARRPLGRGDWIVLQREVSDAENGRAADFARRAGAKVLLNLAPGGAISNSYLRSLEVLVMNESEAALLASSLGFSNADPAGVARALDARYGITTVVTLGAAGVLAVAGGKFHKLPALAVEVVDTTGAGDVFVGVLAAALHRELELESALRRAGAAASLACRTLGAQAGAPDAAAIDRALSRE